VEGGVQLGPLGTAATNMPIVPAPYNYDDGEIGGMIGRGNRSNGRKRTAVLLCPPQTRHAARTRTGAATEKSQRLPLELRHSLMSIPRILCYNGSLVTWTVAVTWQRVCMSSGAAAMEVDPRDWRPVHGNSSSICLLTNLEHRAQIYLG
jgi:hypothetical protein